MKKQDLTNSVREAFKYHAPGWIGIDRIIEFIEWGEKYSASSEEIIQVIEILLHEGYIVKCHNGWQIATAAKKSTDCCQNFNGLYKGKTIQDIPLLASVLEETNTDFKKWETTFRCKICNQIWIEKFEEKGHGEVPCVFRQK